MDAKAERRLTALDTAYRGVQRTIADALAKALDQWDLARFNQGENDLRWAKEQSSAVARNSVLLSGAIVTASGLVAINQYWFFGVLVAQALIAVYWEFKLHTFAKHTRERVNKLLCGVGKRSEDEKTDNHVILAFGLCAIIVLAAGAAIAAPLLPRVAPRTTPSAVAPRTPPNER
jgi:hypothetical protein